MLNYELYLLWGRRADSIQRAENEQFALFQVLALLHCKCSVIQSEIDNSRMRKPDINFHALLGIKLLDNIPFLMVAEEAEPCCNIGASTIF